MSARVTSVIETLEVKQTQQGKNYQRVKTNGKWYSYWDKLQLAQGMTIAFSEVQKGKFWNMSGVNILPAGGTELAPTGGSVDTAVVSALSADLMAAGVDGAEVDAKIAKLNGLINRDAAIVLVAQDHGITADTRRVATPAEGKSCAPSATTITTTTFNSPPPAPQKDEKPISSVTVWFDLKNKVEYAVGTGGVLQISIGQFNHVLVDTADGKQFDLYPSLPLVVTLQDDLPPAVSQEEKSA